MYWKVDPRLYIIQSVKSVKEERTDADDQNKLMLKVMEMTLLIPRVGFTSLKAAEINPYLMQT